jgi:hypothetical protein
MDQSSDTAGESKGLWRDSADLNNVYREVCAEIRATDEISLKLLAAVPLATGIGITLVVRTSSSTLAGPARALLCLFAALVTFAIYRWERKNIATCSHLPKWAASLERNYFMLADEARFAPPQRALPHERVAPPRILGMTWHKTEAVKLLYWTAILGWLSAGVYGIS